MMTRRVLVALGFALVAVILATPMASATMYSVNPANYSVTNDISVLDLWDAYQFNANTGQTVTYSVSVSGSGCVMLLYVKGFDANMNSMYYTAYSQENCVSSYSNSFYVASSDGQAFSILVLTTSSAPVTYTVNINASSGISPVLVTVLLIILVPIAVVVIVVILLVRRRRRRAAAFAQPITPPPTAGVWLPQSPGQPPAQPPQEPPQQLPPPPGSSR